MRHVPEKKRPDEVLRPSPETVWQIWESVSGGRSMARADLARSGFAVRRAARVRPPTGLWPTH